MSEVRLPPQLLWNLEDPFEVFPLEIALRRLAQVVEEDFAELWLRYEDAAPKHREVGLETGIEAVSILLGAGFVAAQATINRTVATLEEVRRAAGDLIPEKDKPALRRIAALSRGGVADIPGINALANYFKHNGEWPRPWNEHPHARQVEALGLSWNNPDNMLIGAETLGFGGKDGLSKLAARLGEWRLALADEIRRRAGIEPEEPPEPFFGDGPKRHHGAVEW